MRRKILLFALVFVPIFAVCIWLFPHVLPIYKKAVVGTINVGLGWLDPPLRVEVTEDGGWRAYQREPDGTESRYWYRPGKYLNLTFLGIALLPALLLATPVSPLRRLVLLGLGLAFLYVMYIPAGFGLVWSVRCLDVNPASEFCRWLRTIVNVYGQLTSIVLWGLLTWDVWLPEDEADAELSEAR